jgi:cystathionine beta-synthase
VVTVLCDTGERYLSKVFNDEWMRENQLLEPEKATLGQLLGAKTGAAPAIVSTAPGASVRQALGLMSLHDISQLPVMDGSNCVGSVSEHVLSVRGLEDSKVLERTVADVMDAPFPVVDAGMPADAAVKLLGRNNPALLVRDHGTVQGIITRSDLLQFLMAR